MIRRILMASAGAFALTGAAFAADLPSRAPPPAVQPTRVVEARPSPKKGVDPVLGTSAPKIPVSELIPP